MRISQLFKKEMENTHPYIPEAHSLMEQGRISRREFIRTATLLGMSATLAVACSTGGGDAGSGESGGGDGDSGGITRGGSIVIGANVQLLDHPARLSWIEPSNIVRQVAEYLTETGPDNITTPLLVENWTANEDVTEWTFKLKEGIMFNNGDELTADDVMFNFGQWLDPEIGSSMLGLLSYLDGMNSVEKVDDYTVKLSLTSGNIGVPEHLFHYPAAIMHRDFEGDFIKQPIGTGPFTLEEYLDGERVVLKRREGYWQNGADGEALPYLDEIRTISLDKDAAVAALQSGQIHSMYNPRPADWQALKDNADMTVEAASTAQTIVLRARIDTEPFGDPRVMNALKMCQDRERILQLSYFGEGDLGADAHIAPVHPAYPADTAIPAQDTDAAKAMLEEWAADTGGSLPLQLTLVTKNDEGEAEYAQALKEMAEPAGFDLALDITEPNGYWERWDEVPLGITAWTHRPLATMVLPLAYIADAEGNPVPWNETRWTDAEFGEILKVAEGTLDVEARRAEVAKLITIFQERGPIGIPFFKKTWRIVRKEVMNLPAHPTSYDLLVTTWLKEA